VSEKLSGVFGVISGSTNIELQNVSRFFSATEPVIANFYLKIAAGEFLALLGPSGCGKSTLLRLIAGLDLADSGKIQMVSSQSKQPAPRGFVFQDSALLPWRTVLQNVCLPLELLGRQGSAVDLAERALERVGLKDALRKFPNQLSGGMKMRVSVARALIAQPSLLLLDEPFTALDERTRHQLQEDLRELWQEMRMTVIFVTHSVSEAVFLANRAVILSSRPARILADELLQLPQQRPGALRMQTEFLSEMNRIYRLSAEAEVLEE
jgi:NitT/TauT family transport system ATP-binding protein